MNKFKGKDNVRYGLSEKENFSTTTTIEWLPSTSLKPDGTIRANENAGWKWRYEER